MFMKYLTLIEIKVMITKKNAPEYILSTERLAESYRRRLDFSALPKWRRMRAEQGGWRLSEPAASQHPPAHGLSLGARECGEVDADLANDSMAPTLRLYEP